MLRKTAVISISLPMDIFFLLENLRKETAKTRSDVIKDMLVSYANNKSWEEIFRWGRQTKQRMKIKSEEDIVKLIND